MYLFMTKLCLVRFRRPHQSKERIKMRVSLSSKFRKGSPKVTARGEIHKCTHKWRNKSVYKKICVAGLIHTHQSKKHIGIWLGRMTDDQWRLKTSIFSNTLAVSNGDLWIYKKYSADCFARQFMIMGLPLSQKARLAFWSGYWSRVFLVGGTLSWWVMKVKKLAEVLFDAHRQVSWRSCDIIHIWRRWFRKIMIWPQVRDRWCREHLVSGMVI